MFDGAYWISTEAEGRKAVDELAAEKVDIVKVYVDDWKPRHNEKLTPAVYGAVIDEAHEHGLRVTAHIRELEDAKGCYAPGSMPSRTACVTRTSTRKA